MDCGFFSEVSSLRSAIKSYLFLDRSSLFLAGWTDTPFDPALQVAAICRDVSAAKLRDAFLGITRRSASTRP
jgi:hypothetical protein